MNRDFTAGTEALKEWQKTELVCRWEGNRRKQDEPGGAWLESSTNRNLETGWEERGNHWSSLFGKAKRTVVTNTREGSLARNFIAGGEVGQNKQVILVLEPGNMSIFREVLEKKRARAWINNKKKPHQNLWNLGKEADTSRTDAQMSRIVPAV